MACNAVGRVPKEYDCVNAPTTLKDVYLYLFDEIDVILTDTVSMSSIELSLEYGSNLIFAGNWFGYGDLSRNIQSMSSFLNANILLTAFFAIFN